MKQFILSLFVLALISGCEKDTELVKPDSDDYLVFGWFYGECWGPDCVKVYKIQDGKLYRDIYDENNFWNITFDDTPMSDEKYEIAKVMLEEFPDQILDETKDTFGCPDCGDWGGMHLQLAQGDLNMTWRIDLQDNDLPEYLIPYKNRMLEVVEQLD